MCGVLLRVVRCTYIVRCTLYAVRFAPVHFALYVARCTLHVVPGAPHSRCVWYLFYCALAPTVYPYVCVASAWCGVANISSVVPCRAGSFLMAFGRLHNIYLLERERANLFFHCVWVKAKLSCGAVLCTSRQTPRSGVVLQHRVAACLAWQMTLSTS